MYKKDLGRFRGKPIDGGGWVEGYYLPLDDGYTHYIMSGKQVIDGFTITFERVAVVPCTVGRLDPLTGKYEGDVCRHTAGRGESYFGIVRYGPYDRPDVSRHTGFYVEWDRPPLTENLYRWAITHNLPGHTGHVEWLGPAADLRRDIPIPEKWRTEG